MSLTVDFWGVRGSLPFALTPSEMTIDLRAFMFRFFQQGNMTTKDIDPFLQSIGTATLGGFGSATTCVQVTSSNQTMIIDAGTGIKNLGDMLMNGPSGQGDATIHIFLTHFHWDHLIGLPYFKPAFIEGNEIIFYAVQPNVEALIRNYLRHPWVENDLSTWKSKIGFQVLHPRIPVTLNDMTIVPYMMDHPDACWGFKVSSGGKNYAHCADTEATRVTHLSLGEDLPMYQNVDLMYFDAQYTLGELADRINWGHSAAQIGLDLAFRENIKHVLFSHHDPISTASTINMLIRQTEEYYRWKIDQGSKQNLVLPPVEWGFVFEGQTVKL
jgi:phosphoribosyl 1,2-cyclic phosphodiesterase